MSDTLPESLTNLEESITEPVIMPESKTADFIKEFIAPDPGNKPVVPVFNAEGFKEKIDTLYTLNTMKKSAVISRDLYVEAENGQNEMSLIATAKFSYTILPK